ncbi:hypothetical protein B0H19DRAFT_1068645 [Mycena capillaripes]|nr:hypothetical protein B0H19DRAFT_1068645 [Mycena capillaripes]
MEFMDVLAVYVNEALNTFPHRSEWLAHGIISGMIALVAMTRLDFDSAWVVVGMIGLAGSDGKIIGSAQRQIEMPRGGVMVYHCWDRRTKDQPSTLELEMKRWPGGRVGRGRGTSHGQDDDAGPESQTRLETRVAKLCREFDDEGEALVGPEETLQRSTPLSGNCTPSTVSDISVSAPAATPSHSEPDWPKHDNLPLGGPRTGTRSSTSRYGVDVSRYGVVWDDE